MAFKQSITLQLRRLHPVARVLTFATGAAVLFGNNNVAIVGTTAVVLLALGFCLQQGVYRAAVFGMLAPFAALQLIVYGIVLRTAPGGALGSSSVNGLMYALLIISRISGTYSLGFCLFGILGHAHLFAFLRGLKAPVGLAQTVVSSLIVSEDVLHRAALIADARFARGYCAKRTSFQQILQLVPSVGALFGSVLITAIERFKVWERERLFDRFAELATTIGGLQRSAKSPSISDLAPSVSNVREKATTSHDTACVLVVGSNFSGRSEHLSDWSNGIGCSYLGPDVTASISGLRGTVADEWELHWGTDLRMRQGIEAAAEELGLGAILQKNPFAFEMSGGQEVMVAVLAKLALRAPRLAIDTCLENLSNTNRLKILTALCKLGDSILLADNRPSDIQAFASDTVRMASPQQMSFRPSAFEARVSQASRLEVESVAFGYKSHSPVFNNLTLRLEPGVYALKGENGSGKTTFARLLLGLRRPWRGSIRHKGTEVSPYSSPGQLAAVAFQNPDRQFFGRSVAAEFAKTKLASDVVSAFGFETIMRTHPRDLPWTFQKRLSIAITVAQDTPWLILDEPTIGQDEASVHELAALVRYLCSQGKGVIIITHHVEFGEMTDARSIDLQSFTSP